MTNFKYYLIAAVLLSATIDCLGQNILRGPYLQLNTPTSIIIRWRTDQATGSKVWYGDSPSNLTSTFEMTGNRTEHEMQITGLTPSTKYYYAVGNNNGPIAGADQNHYFKTSPIPGTSEPISVWALGCAGTQSNDQRAVRDAFYSYNGGPHADLILALGDNAYEDGTDQEFQYAWFENMYETSLTNSVVWPAFGNHDGISADSDDESGPYYDIFNMPRNGEAGGVPSGTEAYYSFDYGNAHFICLNSHDVDKDANSPMLAWLEEDLQATDKEWIIAFFHHYPYFQAVEMRTIFLPALEAGGVDFVVYAHSHAYQRSFLINGAYGEQGTFDWNENIVDGGDGRLDGDGAYEKPRERTPNAGTVYMLAGSAGQGAGPRNVEFMPFESEGHPMGSVHMAIDGSQMDVKLIDYYGAVTDHFTMIKLVGTNPSITLTNPLNGTTYPTPQTIDLEATATDPDGFVTQVEFFVDGASVGIDNAEPYAVSWTPPLQNFYQIYAVVTDNDGNTKTSSTATVQMGIPLTGSVDVAIAGPNDDAEENLNNSAVSLTSSDLELGYETTRPQLVGMRFVNVDVQPGSNITNAYIQFTLDEVTEGTANLLIVGEAVDDAAAFQNVARNISSRLLTDAQAAWSPADWDGGTTNGPAQRTVDISHIVEEIINRPGWQAKNAMGFLISGTGTRTAASFDGSSVGAPVLHIEYDNTPACTNIGEPCDDGDGCTDNDVIGADCNCAGTLRDADNDGVCDDEDICAGDDTVDSDDDGVPDDCDVCPLAPNDDSDGDGVCDDADICPEGDDTVDSDGDGVPDACDACPNSNPDDSDGDGICDDADICPDGDDTVDTDQDGVPDACDVCPNSNPDDSDGDGVCDDADICPDGDDTVDTDLDGVPDTCDMCTGDDASGDTDMDGFCDNIDNCPEDYNPLQSDTDGDGVGDVCVGDWMLSVVVYLQGPYDAGTGLMQDQLRARGLLPLEEPYGGLGYTHAGGGGGEQTQQSVFEIAGTNAIVDWVLLELRDKVDPDVVRATRSALLQADGDVVDVDGVSPVIFADLPANEYYVVVKHRNHVGVMSAMPVAMSDVPAVLDFTSNPSAIYGGPNGIGDMGDGKMGLLSGDFNHNDQIQNTDYAAVVLTLGMAGYVSGDFNLNGEVQNTDLQLHMLPNIGRGAAFPW